MCKYPLAILLAALIATSSIANFDGNNTSGYSNNRMPLISKGQKQDMSAGAHVERGLRLLNPGGHHPISLQEWEMEGLPSLYDLPNEKRIRYAIREFAMALRKQKQDPSYTLAQIYSYLGLSYRMLAVDFQKQAERQEDGGRTADTLSRRYFERSIAYYTRAMRSDPGSLEDVLAEEIVRTIAASGDLLRALRTINSFEKHGIRPPANSDHGLIKLKADIYFFLGRRQDAGLAYEEWIGKGGTDIKLAPGDQLYQKLQVLRSRTGHPNNLPSK